MHTEYKYNIFSTSSLQTFSAYALESIVFGMYAVPLYAFSGALSNEGKAFLSSSPVLGV